MQSTARASRRFRKIPGETIGKRSPLGSKRSHRAELTQRRCGSNPAHVHSGSQAMTEHTAERAFAAVAAGVAILFVRIEIDALALAARLARWAARPALPVIAGRRGTPESLAHRSTVAAVVHIRARIDTGRATQNERGQTAELALAHLTRGRGVRGRHAYFTASTAVGSISLRVHARAVTSRLRPARKRAHSVFADFCAAAGFTASAAILRVGALVDAAAGAIGVAAVAAHCALPAAADCSSVGRGCANLAAGAAVVEVGIELLAAPVTRAVTSRAGQGTNRALANGSRMSGGFAGFRAITAVCRVYGQIHA